jgi:hypothetical protein
MVGGGRLAPIWASAPGLVASTVCARTPPRRRLLLQLDLGVDLLHPAPAG